MGIRIKNWTYGGESFTDVSGYFGFIYVITNNITGTKYVGKKLFTKAGYKQTKGKRKKIRKVSEWKTYFGSGPRIQEDVKKYGKRNFTREIIRLCMSRGETNYWESYEIFVRHALRRQEYLNDWISCKISRKHLIVGKNECPTQPPLT